MIFAPPVVQGGLPQFVGAKYLRCKLLLILMWVLTVKFSRAGTASVLGAVAHVACAGECTLASYSVVIGLFACWACSAASVGAACWLVWCCVLSVAHVVIAFAVCFCVLCVVGSNCEASRAGTASVLGAVAHVACAGECTLASYSAVIGLSACLACLAASVGAACWLVWCCVLSVAHAVIAFAVCFCVLCLAGSNCEASRAGTASVLGAVAHVACAGECTLASYSAVIGLSACLACLAASVGAACWLVWCCVLSVAHAVIAFCCLLLCVVCGGF